MPSGNERPSGLRAFFRKHKRSSASPPDNATSQKPAEKVDAKEERRAYVPRYARRDMFLAVPVEERPDLVAKANEARLRNVCSEIGFNTTPSSSSASLRSSAGRIKNLHSQASQPSLRRTQENAPGRTFDAGPSRETVAGSSRAPLHEPSMSMPAVELPGSKNTTETYWRGMASTYHRLASRPSQSALVGPASLDDRAEGLNRAFPRMQSINTEGASYGPATFVTRPTDTASSTCRTQRGYFGHGVALPNLRASEVMPKGKGKAPIYDVGRHCDETTPTPTGASHDVRESVVIRMQGGRMPPHLSAPPAPPSDSSKDSRDTSYKGSRNAVYQSSNVSLAPSTSTFGTEPAGIDDEGEPEAEAEDEESSQGAEGDALEIKDAKKSTQLPSLRTSSST